MRSKELYSVIAVILPVSLGFGLIYLHAVGRIEALTAVAAVVALGVLIGCAAVLAGVIADDPQRYRGISAHRF